MNIYFLAAMGFHRCVRAYPSCSDRGLLCSCSAQVLTEVASLLWSTGSRVHRRRELPHTGLVALRRVGSSRTRDRTHVPCIGRRILNPWTTKEAQ